VSGPDAVLIDLDGTLVDTVAVWHDAYLRLAAGLGVTLAEGFWPSIAGRSMQDSLAVFATDDAPSAHDPDVLVARLVAAAAEGLAPDGTPRWSWLPGAEGLLDALWAASGTATGRAPGSDGPVTALVTSAWRAFTRPLLDAALGARASSFDTVVCGDEVARSKPAPDPYLEAAARLGVDPARCLVIEDSPTGVASAEAAGMVVLAVPHAGPVARTTGREVRSDLVGLTPEGLAELYARLRSQAMHRGR
jgi:beta-phosphoglucomutase-like phosphatase (HAD superfamily)